jgi:iron complex outermembrane receptor protein
VPGKTDRLFTASGAVLAMLMCVLLPWPAQPGELTADELLDFSLEELVDLEVRVASRIPTNTLNAASSVEVIPEATWQRRGARNISAVLATLPGIALVPGLAGADAFAIRGYTRSTSLIGVLLSWDGVPLNDLFRGAPTLNLPGLNLGAIEEIQLIEGPGSALYGSDAFHGVVALNAFDADADQRELHGGVRDNGFYAAGARVSAEVGERTRASVALTADGQSDQELDFHYADPVSGLPRSGERSNRYAAQSASIKLRGTGSAGVSWRGGALIHHYDGEDFQGFGTRLAATRDLGGVNTDLYLANGGIRKERADESALEISAYAWHTDSVLNAGRETFDFESANTQRRYGAHATYESGPTAWNTEWALVVGLEELVVEKARTRTFDLTGATLLDAVNPAEDATRRIYSATFEGNTHWSAEHWRLVYGVRLDRYSDFGDRASPRVGLIWHPQQNNAIKLLYGNAFRAPTANDLHGTAGLIQANENLKPEDIDTLELVLMHQSAAWFTELTLFHSDWHDGIVSVANLGGVEPFVFTNLEENRAHGVTWDFTWQADPWLLNVGASWVRSENSTLEQNYDAFPRYIVDAEVGYHHAPWRTHFYLTQHWQIETDDVFPPNAGFSATPLPLYSRTDIAAVHPLSPKWKLMFFARNLFDRDNFFPSSAGSRGGIPDETRTISAEVRFAF